LDTQNKHETTNRAISYLHRRFPLLRSVKQRNVTNQTKQCDKHTLSKRVA